MSLTPSFPVHNGYARVRDNLAFLLLLLTLLLFTSSSLYNVPMSIMALLGAWRAVRAPREIFAEPLVRLFTLLFLCVWVPMILSLPDAANPGHSSSTVLPYLRFLFMGIYILQQRNLTRLVAWIRPAVFCIVSFWGIDAVIQYLAGANLFGYPHEPGHITGMFYPKNTIAHILAALSPLYFDSIRKFAANRPWLWLLVLPLFAVVLLSGRRAAWIMLAISTTGYLLYLLRVEKIGKNARRQLLAAALVVVSAGAAVIGFDRPLQERIITTAGLFSLEYETADRATARRLPIWETALAVFRDNPINGVGPRGYRHVYRQYSDPDDFWHATGASHPHQLLLEILAETGLIGFTGLLVFFYLAGRFFAGLYRHRHVFPWILAVCIVLFPLNSNMAFYGSYWSSVIWWLLVMALAAAGSVRREDNRVRNPSRPDL